MGGILSSVGRFFASYDQKGLATIRNETRELAWFAKQTYSRDPPKEHLGFVLRINNRTVKVYVNDELKIVVFAVRGTQITDNYDDIETDLKLAIGSEEQTERFKVADGILRFVLRRYPDYKILLTGHSLGGGIVYRLADRHKTLTGEVFNPAVNLTTLRDQGGTSSRVRAHIIHGDPVAGIVGRPLRNAQVYSPAYGADREKILRMPLTKRLQYLHALDRFPRT